MKEDLYQIKLIYDGVYKIYEIMALNEMDAIKKFEKRINVAKEYMILTARKMEVNEFVIQRGITPSGIVMQIENWNKAYSNTPKNSTIGFYPRATTDIRRDDSIKGMPPYPKRGETFRASLEFENEDKAWEVFKSLMSGEKTFNDFLDNFKGSSITKDEFILATS